MALSMTMVVRPCGHSVADVLVGCSRGGPASMALGSRLTLPHESAYRFGTRFGARPRQAAMVLRAVSTGGSSGQLLLAATTCGNSEWMQVLEGEWDAEEARPAEEGCVVGWKGQTLRLLRGEEDESVTYEKLGVYPAENGALCRKFPAMKRKLEACYTHAGDPTFKISFIEVAYSLAELQQAVQADPSQVGRYAQSPCGHLASRGRHSLAPSLHVSPVSVSDVMIEGTVRNTSPLDMVHRAAQSLVDLRHTEIQHARRCSKAKGLAHR